MNKDDNDYINIGESVKNLKHIYKKTTYFKSYGTSIFLFILITFIFFLFFSYFNVKNHVHKYQSDPAKYRCDPSVMPFAGHIFQHPGMTNSQFNRSNIMYCMREVLKDMLSEILLPFEYISQLIQSIHLGNLLSLNFLRTIFSDILNALSGIFGLIYNLLENLFASINNIIVYLSDAFIKTITIPLSVFYASTLVIYCLRIIARFVLASILDTLFILSGIMVAVFIYVYIAAYVAVEFIPIIGEIIAPLFSWGLAMGVASIFLVTYIIISVIYGEIAHAIEIGLELTAPEAPQAPSLRPPIMGRGRRRR